MCGETFPSQVIHNSGANVCWQFCQYKIREAIMEQLVGKGVSNYLL
jgi:hypothetical protein